MPMIFHSRDEFEQEVILLFRDGWKIRPLARKFGVSRNTIRRIVRDHKRGQKTAHEILPAKIKRGSSLDEFAGEIQKCLEKFPKITGIRLREILADRGYSGGITIVRDHLRKVRPAQREEYIRFETGPGQQGQMDWSPYTLRFTRTGKAQVLCFSYILGFSRRHFITFTTHRDFFTLIRRHVDAFTHFGGVPRECLYDNEKTVVLRWESGRPVFNPAFTAFITHYTCRPIACRPRTPQTKGKVEAPFQYIEKNLLGGREFQDMEDLMATARWWLSEKSDRHVHSTTRRPPIDIFLEEEQAALQPLPAFPYDTAEVARALGRGDGFVLFETNHYSVPSGHTGDILSLKATEREVLIYSPELKLLARHERAPAGLGKGVEDPSHRRGRRDRYGLEPVREAFLSLGEAAQEFLDGLVAKTPRNCGSHARFILSLKESYQSDDIHRALQHAVRYGAFDGKSIERILHARAQPRTLESVRNEQARQALEKTLPRIIQTPLTAYADLFDQKEDTHGTEARNSDQNPNPSGNPETQGHSEDPGSGAGRGGPETPPDQ
jgi:transposase